MSNAKATLISAIIGGLAKSAHLTGASVKHAEIQVDDVIEEVFHPSTVWAVRDYLKEIGEYDAR